MDIYIDTIINIHTELSSQFNPIIESYNDLVTIEQDYMTDVPDLYKQLEDIEEIAVFLSEYLEKLNSVQNMVNEISD